MKTIVIESIFIAMTWISGLIACFAMLVSLVGYALSNLPTLESIRWSASAHNIDSSDD